MTYTATVIVDPKELGGGAYLVINGTTFVLRGRIVKGLRALAQQATCRVLAITEGRADLMQESKETRNARVQARYDELMAEGRHGHYETMFRVVREEIDRTWEQAQKMYARHESAQPDRSV